MGDALQIYYSAFDTTFFTLSAEIRSRIEEKIDDMGRRLDTFPHRRLKAQNRYRLRIGDYRVIYTFDSEACLTEHLSRPDDSAGLPLRLHDLQLEWAKRNKRSLPSTGARSTSPSPCYIDPARPQDGGATSVEPMSIKTAKARHALLKDLQAAGRRLSRASLLFRDAVAEAAELHVTDAEPQGMGAQLDGSTEPARGGGPTRGPRQSEGLRLPSRRFAGT